MIHITDNTVFDEREVEERIVRRTGAGSGKRAAAGIELRFNVARSSLPIDVKHRLIAAGRRHVTASDVFVVAGPSDGSLTRRRDTALGRLLRFVVRASVGPSERRPAL